MARGLADLAKSASRTAEELGKAQRTGVFKAALHTKKLIEVELVRAVGADKRMSNARGRGKLSVGFDVKGSTNPTALIKPRGPIYQWRWLEDGTKDHAIRARGSKLTKRGNRRPGARALTAPGGLYSRVWVRGMEPKKPWDKGKRKAIPDTPRIFQLEIRKAVAGAWK